MSTSIISPKVFVSYSWKPELQKQRVLDLVNRLSEDGIHVIIDEWDLQNGQDKNKFMEQMVNDQSVQKVLLICTKEYAMKANARAGGVGIESTIVSAEVYENTDQTKFIPLVFEVDERRKAYVPTYLTGRIYIDFSDPALYEENYDKLIRDIYDRPLNKRPPIGTRPSYLEDELILQSPLRNRLSALKSAYLNERKNAQAFLDDYLSDFITSLSSYLIDVHEFTPKNVVEVIDGRIESMTLLQDSFIELLNFYIKHISFEGAVHSLADERLHKFFQDMLSFLFDRNEARFPNNTFGWYTLDAFRFLYYETFLKTTALLIKQESFTTLAYLLHNPYYVSVMGNLEAFPFMGFYNEVTVLNYHKKQKFQRNDISVTATLIKDRCSSDGLFQELKQADILLYYLSCIYPHAKNRFPVWYPELSAFNWQPIPILPKTISKKYFDRCKVLFGVMTTQELFDKITKQWGNGVPTIHMPFDVQDPLIALNFKGMALYP